MITKKRKHKKELNWMKDNLIAHRGFHNQNNGVPENSLKAFKYAIESGFAVECDVRISKDNVVYVIHDNNLQRLCGLDTLFETLTSVEINALTLLNTTENIPTFKELLRVINNQVPLLIEIKPTKRYKKLCKALVSELDNYKGVYAIQSYNPIIVHWFKKHKNEIPRGIISESYGYPYQPNYLIWWLSHLSIWAKIVDADFYNYNIKDLPNSKMDSFKQKGGLVLSFTARSEKDLQFVKEQYDNAVFEKFTPSQK